MPGLFDPITIQGLTLKNRIVMPPMSNRMAGDDGAVLDRHIAHYAARAGAQVGLIVVEHAYVDRGGRAGETQLGIPVIGVGNIREAEYADRVVREGRIDLVAVGRALLADPLWALKAAEKLGVPIP
jgi:2,4-dienoyl-CoA reductase-like NADH-dependent reductase (Old Yellow Enzyme family)